MKPHIVFHPRLRRWMCGDKDTVAGFGATPSEALLNWIRAFEAAYSRPTW